MKIGMTGIFVHDPIVAHKYYTEFLGFKSHTFMPEMQLAVVISPEDAGNTALLLSPSDNPLGRDYREGLYIAGIPAIVFSSSDIYAEYEKLKALGVAFKGEPVKTAWGIQVLFDDTCGNWIQLHQIA